MEQEKRGRGRPKIDTHITEAYATSRRQAVNAVYMYEGVELISVAAAEIPDGDLLWRSDASTQMIQDKFSQDDCITIASFAIQALKAGHTSREIEKAIRKVRLTNKKASADPENEALNHAAVNALDELRSMGDTGNTGL